MTRCGQSAMRGTVSPAAVRACLSSPGTSAVARNDSELSCRRRCRVRPSRPDQIIVTGSILGVLVNSMRQNSVRLCRWTASPAYAVKSENRSICVWTRWLTKRLMVINIFRLQVRIQTAPWTAAKGCAQSRKKPSNISRPYVAMNEIWTDKDIRDVAGAATKVSRGLARRASSASRA